MNNYLKIKKNIDIDHLIIIKILTNLITKKKDRKIVSSFLTYKITLK